VSFELVVVSVI